MDVFGFRIVVRHGRRSATTRWARCTRCTSRWTARFRDFIAIPKANGYQSLHTVLFGPLRLADRGADPHRGNGRDRRARHRRALAVQEPAATAATARRPARTTGCADLLEAQRVGRLSLEFLENVKVDLFPDEVYLFTPKGDILSLPRNATALDFAYAVHTDVGNHAVAARVDKKLVPLRTKLVSGQTVEIITAPSARAEAAVARLRGHRQGAHRDPPPAQAASSTRTRCDLGHRMLDRALEALDSSLDRVAAGAHRGVPGRAPLPRLEELLADIALGNRMPAQVAQVLRAGRPPNLPRHRCARSGERILITGAERGVLSFARCCYPIPGDEIRRGTTTAPRRSATGRKAATWPSPAVADRRAGGSAWIAQRRPFEWCCGFRSMTWAARSLPPLCMRSSNIALVETRSVNMHTRPSSLHRAVTRQHRA